MERPLTTLFMLASVDGKISTGDTDAMDVDKDYKNIPGLKEGLQQYYDLEQETDLFSLNTGKVFAKLGVNNETQTPSKLPVSYIVIDNRPHLTEAGVAYLAKKSARLFVVTMNKSHPAFSTKKDGDNIEIIFYGREIDFADLMQKLRTDYGVEKLTVQSGGTLNSVLVRKGLIDRVLLVVAPALIGGKDTPTLVDGKSLHTPSELGEIKTLELVSAKPLKDSYVFLEYKLRH